MSEEADDDGVGWSKAGCKVFGLHLNFDIRNFRVRKRPNAVDETRQRGWNKCSPWKKRKKLLSYWMLSVQSKTQKIINVKVWFKVWVWALLSEVCNCWEVKTEFGRQKTQNLTQNFKNQTWSFRWKMPFYGLLQSFTPIPRITRVFGSWKNPRYVKRAWVIIITRARLRWASGELDAVNRVRFLYIYRA